MHTLCKAYQEHRRPSHAAYLQELPRRVPNFHAATPVGPNQGSGEVLRDPEEGEMILARGGAGPGKESWGKWHIIGPLIQVRCVLVDMVSTTSRGKSVSKYLMVGNPVGWLGGRKWAHFSER